MSSKVERERAALQEAERDLEARRRKLAELEEEEEQKALDKLVKKVSRKRAIEILELSLQVKPKAAVERLKRGGQESQQAVSESEGQSSPEAAQEG